MKDCERARLHPDEMKLLCEIRNMLRLVLKSEGIIMADLDTLNSLIDGLSGDFDALEGELTAAQQAAQNNQPVDLSGAISKLQALKAKADTASQVVGAAATPSDSTPASSDGSAGTDANAADPNAPPAQ